MKIKSKHKFKVSKEKCERIKWIKSFINKVNTKLLKKTILIYRDIDIEVSDDINKIKINKLKL